ncbi:MAG: hypothetical protein AAF488_03555 [Planctomycetota bacterium]
MSRIARSACAFVVLALAFFVTAPAHAGSVDTTGPFAMLTGQLQGRGDAEALFLWDKAGQRLAIYLVTPSKMELLFVRNCAYDFEVDVNPGKMTPSPAEVRRLVGDGTGKGDDSARPKKEPKPETPSEPEGEAAPEKAAKPAVKAKPAQPVVAPRPETEGWTLSLGKLQGGNADALYIMSHQRQRLAVYAIRANVLELLFSRDCSADLEIGRSFGRTTPRVKDLQDEVSRRKKEGKKKANPNPRNEREGEGAKPRL